jgi:hypothetical protein
MYEAPNNVNPLETEPTPTETVTAPTETAPTETVTAPNETFFGPFIKGLYDFDPDDYPNFPTDSEERLPGLFYVEKGELENLAEAVAANNAQRKREKLSSEPVLNGIARFILREITGGNPQDATLETMIDGTAPLALRETPDFTDEERRIIFNSPENIIMHFTRGPGGRGIVQGDQLSAMATNAERGAYTGALQTSAFLLGMEKTNRLIRNFVPKNKAQALARIVSPVFGGVASAIAANTPIELTEEMLLGPDDVFLPGTGGPSRVTRGIFEDVFGGFGVIKRIEGDTNLGFRHLFNTSKPKKFTDSGLGAGGGYTVADDTGKIVARFPRTVSGKKEAEAFVSDNPGTREAFNPRAITNAFGSRTYYKPEGRRVIPDNAGIRMSRTMEGIIDRIKDDAKQYPFVFLGSELAASAAGQATRESALQNDNTALNTFLLELGANMGAGYSMDLLLRKAVPALKGLSKAAFSPVQTARNVAASGGAFFSGQQNQQESDVQVFLQAFLEKHGSSTEEVLKALDSNEYGVFRESWLKNNPGKSLPETTALATNNPAILKLEEAMANSFFGGASISAAQKDTLAKEAASMILDMYFSGDSTLAAAAAENMKDMFELNLQEKVDVAKNNVLDALERVSPNYPESASSANIEAFIGRKLKNVVEEQQQRSKTISDALYKRVDPELRVENFVDLSTGEETNVPNVVSFWESIIDAETTHSDRVAFKRIADLIAYSKSKAKDLNIPFSGPTQQSLNFEYFYNALSSSPDLKKAFDNLSDSKGWDEPGQDTLTSLDDWLNRNYRRGETKTPLIEAVQAKRNEIQKGVVDSRSGPSDENDLDGISVRGLAGIRSAALEIERDFPGTRSAAIALGFRTAVEADLDALPPGASVDLDVARANYRAYVDVFKRQFPGEILGKRKGAPIINPDNIVGLTFRNVEGSKQFREISQMGKLAAVQHLGALFSGAPEVGNRLRESFLEAVSVFPDRGDGDIIDLRKAREWIQANKEDLDIYSGFKVQFSSDPKTGKLTGEMVESGTLFDSLNETIEDAVTTEGLLETALRQIKHQAFQKFDPENPATFNVNEVRKWVNNDANKETLKALPDLKADLDAILEGETGFLSIFVDTLKGTEKKIADKRKDFSFYTLLPDKDSGGFENPSAAVHSALSKSNTPFQNLGGLLDVVRHAPDSWISKIDNVTYTKEDAMDGFRSAVMDYALANPGRLAKDFDPLVVYQNLFAPIQKGEGRQSLADWLVDNKVFSKTHLENLQKSLGQAAKLQNKAKTGTPAELDKLMGQMAPGVRVIASVAGSSVGGNLAQAMGSPNSLIAQGTTAAAARDLAAQVFEAVPGITKANIIKRVLEDPAYAQYILRKGKSEEENARIVGGLARKLIVDGTVVPPLRRGAVQVVPSVFEEDEAEQFREDTPERLGTPASNSSNSSSAALNIFSTANAAEMPAGPVGPYRPQALAPRPAAPAPMTGAANPEQRARMQQLFPGDTMMTGIGSL